MITRAGVTPPAAVPASTAGDRSTKAPPPAAWVRTLGRLELMAGTPEAPGARLMGPSKPVALLAYLALAPRRRATRDQLLALLWSDADPERARSTLRQTLWALRQRLGDGALVTDGDDVVLAQPLATDCDRFLAAVAQGALAEAWARYGGPFVPDFALIGGAGFEHWADQKRARLAAAWQTVGESLARAAIDGSRPRDAIPILRTLVAATPDRTEVWRLLLEAHVANGDRLQALADADQLEQQWAAAGRRPDAALRALIERLRRPVSSPLAPEGHRRPELVGREATLAALLGGWRRASDGSGVVMVVRASAGLGKTRMLAELHQRLTDLGGHVVSLRARSADRDVPYALAAALAAAVAECPGAAGVSSATASALVDLAPALSNTFPRAAGTTVPDVDALRVRTLALLELLQAVTEEAPLTVLVDDLHWADDPSRQLLASLCERIAGVPLLLVLAMRPMRGDWPVPDAAAVVELLPLSPDQVELLLASLARADGPFLGELSRTLHSVSGGVPLLVVAALDLALERAWLRIDGEVWHQGALDPLRQALSRGSVLDLLLRDLPSEALAMLTALALVRRPLPAAALRAVAGESDSGVLDSLEQRGLVLPVGQGWEVAHDRLADAALAVVPVAGRRTVATQLARALLGEPSPPARTWQLAGRLLAPVDAAEAARCFRAWMPLTQGPHGWRNPLGAASAFLGDQARVAEVQQLAESIPLVLRLRLGYPLAAAAWAPVLLMAVVSLLTVSGQRWLQPRAVRMELTEPTTSRGFLWDQREQIDALRDEARNPVPLRVSFRSEDGRLTVNTPRAATVRLVETQGAVTLAGTMRVETHAGDASFPDLTLAGSGSFRLEVSADGLPPVRTRRLYAGAEGGRVNAARVTIVEGVVNGQSVDSVRREVRVRPGEPITGTVQFRALTVSRTAAILFGGVALWGDRTTQAFVRRALPPHGETMVREPLEDAVTGRRWVAPRTPGRYAILFVADAETEMRFVASRTNWLLGTPRWNDGNDLADLGPGDLAELERIGYLYRPHTYVANAVLPLRPDALRRTVDDQGRLVAAVLWLRVTAE
jgi:DNA-binding SARP family transcriptional activator